MTIGSAAVAESLFVIGVALATIVPRPKTVLVSFFGGELSRPFRQLMFALVCMNSFRSFFMTDERFRDHRAQTDSSGRTSWATWIYYVMTTTESLGINFLCLLLAYLLQCRLRVLIYIEPGRDLQPWLYAILVFGLLGTIGSIAISPEYWALKRFGDALSCIPVLKTIALYDKVMTRNHILDSQITIQTLRVMEMVNLVATLLAAAGYWFGGGQSSNLTALDSMTLLRNVSIGFRQFGIFANWTRAFCHGLMLNIVDEAQQRPPVVATAPTDTDFQPTTAPFNEVESNSLEISLISR